MSTLDVLESITKLEIDMLVKRIFIGYVHRYNEAHTRGYSIGLIMDRNTMIFSESTQSPPLQIIVQDKLLIGEIMIGDYDDNIATHFYPVIKTIWNAEG